MNANQKPSRYQLKRQVDRRKRKFGGLLQDLRKTLQERGCLVYLPGEWPLETPAKVMIEVLDPHAYVDRALSLAYDVDDRDAKLTPKAYRDGELKIGDVSEDFERLKSVLPSFSNVGEGTVRELRSVLKRTGALDN